MDVKPRLLAIQPGLGEFAVVSGAIAVLVLSQLTKEDSNV
jgi:hypothetical protein